jgi:hypothetical protein
MARLKNLQQALDESVGKTPPPEKPQPVKAASAPAPASKHITAASREGKEFTGAWLHPDYGMGLRMVQLRKRRDAQGKKVLLADLIAEALNDLFAKYDVPTVRHE